MTDFPFDGPDAALAALLPELKPAGVETVPTAAATGRVLAAPLSLDRDSPARDVSSMDGYALRLSDVRPGTVPVSGEAAAGHPPPDCPAGTAVRIFTGAPVPANCELVVKREDVRESSDEITFADPSPTADRGTFVRRRGENGRAGDVLVEPGVPVTAAVVAGAASVGAAALYVHRRVRVAILVTGDEVRHAADGNDAPPAPWQVRDANGPALAALLGPRAFLDVSAPTYVGDDRNELTATLAGLTESHDAVFLTGGVSVGDHDHVPAAVAAVGGRVIFHRLPIRPGKPILAAVADGKLLLGLPGNPVSVLCTARRFGTAALRRLAGFTAPEPVEIVTLTNPDHAALPLHWSRPVRLTPHGPALTETRGSGDVISAARSDGIVEIPAGRPTAGPLPYRPW